MTKRQSLAIGLCALVLAISCSSRTPKPSPSPTEANANSPAIALPDSPEAHERVAELRARFTFAEPRYPLRDMPPHAPPGTTPLPRSVLGEGIATRFETAGPHHVRAVLPAGAIRGTAKAARVALPMRAHDEVHLEDEGSHVAVRFRLQHARDAPVSVADGIALYKGAYQGHDIVHRVHGEGTEDYVIFEKKPAREELVYDVDVSRVAGLRLIGDTLEFMDAGGAPRLRIAPPSVVDAKGERRAARLRVEGCAVDRNPAGPWGRAVVATGSTSCMVYVMWSQVECPMVVDPVWTTTGAMPETCTGHSAVLLASDKVLIDGPKMGASFCYPVLYDPASGTFGATGGGPHGMRLSAGISLLGSGKVLVAGGWDVYSSPNTVATAVLYDPATGLFVATGSMATPRRYPTATLLDTGKVLVAGGRNESAGKLSSAELYDPGTGVFTSTGPMTIPREQHTATRLGSGKVLIVGSNPSTTSTELYDPTAGAFASTGATANWRNGHSATLLGSGKVLIAGGMPGSDPIASAELYDPGIGSFAPTGPLLGARSQHTATLLGSGKVLMAGGQVRLSPVLSTIATSELYDPAIGSFITTGSLSFDRESHAATLLASGKVLVTGGVNAQLDSRRIAELFELIPSGSGSTCGVSGECFSGICNDRCCSSACAGTCTTCGEGAGACAPVTSADDPNSCTGVNTCDATAACKLKNGQPSTDPTLCASGFAQDGYCCNTACNNACDVCAASLGASSNGTCTAAPATYVGNPACGDYLCNGAATSCPTTGAPCASDANCSTSGYCAADASCKHRKSQGAQCGQSAGADCLQSGCRSCFSTYCVDGVCCDTNCTAICFACAAALKQSGLDDGTCGTVRYEVAPPARQGSCPSSPPCGADGTCNGTGACTINAPSGTACGSASCSLDVQARYACDGSGTCRASTPLQCTPYACSGTTCATTCTDNGQCVSTAYCRTSDHTCQGVQGLGTTCSSTAQCQTGNCADGVCCDAPCRGPCEACTGALKGGGSDGTCGAVAAGGNPRGRCVDQGVATCGTSGVCDGSGGCSVYAQGTGCSPNTCAQGTQTAFACDGLGLCKPSASSCASYACGGNNCGTGCTSDVQCATDAYCNLLGACAADQANGAPCASASQCRSGVCVDGVCCNSACGGACQACTAAKRGSGVDGECGLIADGTDPDNECSDRGATTCQDDGYCNGAGQCRKYAAGTACGATICTDGASGAHSKRSGKSCDGFGTCIDSGAQDCGLFRCSGIACSATCGTDGDCIDSAHCAAGTCVLKGSLADACTSAANCASGYCADGVCCNADCAGSCQACTRAKKGAGIDGICGPIASGSDPDSECAAQDQSTCGRTGMCDGTGACQLYARRTTCGDMACVDNAFGTHSMANGYACDGWGTCTGTSGLDCGGYRCGSSACLTSCSSTSQCIDSAYCKGGLCVTRHGLGDACAGTNDCASGFCSDGVCCNTACTGTCQACSAAKRGSGSDGTCGPVAVEKDPDDECAEDPVSMCKQTGKCDGAGACQQYEKGIACGKTECADGAFGNQSVQSGYACDGWGKCLPNSSDDCHEFKCSGKVCATTCRAEGDCIQGAYCTSEGKCVARSNNGASCRTGPECATGFCVDGVCCENACDGQCETCNATKPGVCEPARGAPPGNRARCTNAGTDCGGLCDGATTKKCAYPNAVKSCGASRCSAATEYKSHCDGNGACGAPTSTPCVKFACGETECKKSCVVDTDCAPEFKCDRAKADCVPTSAQCDGDHKLVSSVGPATDCAPYRCNATNVCLGQCGSRADCIDGMSCTPEGKCEVAVPLGGVGDVGGLPSCSSAGTPRSASLPPALAVMALALTLFRRRARRGPELRARANRPISDRNLPRA